MAQCGTAEEETTAAALTINEVYKMGGDIGGDVGDDVRMARRGAAEDDTTATTPGPLEKPQNWSSMTKRQRRHWYTRQQRKKGT